MQEQEHILQVSDLSVPADMEYGAVVAQLAISSNQSWSATPLGNCDWVEFSTLEHLNPSNATDTGIIEMSFENNDSKSSRSFILEISGPELKKSVTVTQSGKTARLKVISGNKISVDAEPQIQTIEILSNTDWIAEVVGGEASLKNASGSGNGTVQVELAPNYSYQSDKTVTVSVSAPDIEPVIVEYQLAKNIPFIRVDGKSSLEYLPIDESGLLSFHANAKWKAEVVSSTIGELSLETFEGEEGKIVLPFSFNRNESREQKIAEVAISLKDYPEVKSLFHIAQRGGFAIFVDFSFGKQPLKPASADVPEITSKSISGALTPYSYFFTQDEKDYEFVIRNEAYSYGTNDDRYKGYLLLSAGSIRLPAVPGMRLTTVILTHAATNKRFAISADSYGKEIISGGSVLVAAKYSTISWSLDETENGQSYYLYHLSSLARIVSLTLLYE